MRNPKRLKKTILSMMFFCLLLFKSAFIHASEITEGIKKTIDAVIVVVTDEELKKEENSEKRRKLLREIISRKFSYPEMAKRSLSKYWKERTPEEKKEFIKLFGKLHDNSYAKKIESYSKEKIIYKEEKVRGNIAFVKSIMQKEEESIPINYKLVKIANEWLIYDFIVEGVSILKNYRAQFKSIIRTSSYHDLVKKLKKKVGEIE